MANNSYMNVIVFLLTTLFYYMVLNPELTYATYNVQSAYMTYISNSYMYLAIYVALVVLIQFIINSSVMASMCGGNVSENMGAAGVLTFLPWTLIFGAIVLILKMYPGFKSAFSDVVGYYYVSTSATDLLTELLLNQEIDAKLTHETHTPEQKAALETAADTILKICGNTSILINQMVPSNFNQYWNILKPLMKPKYVSTDAASSIKEELFKLVVTRDTVGEAMWYIYTGLLLTSIVQLKITTRGCASNPKTMEANYNKYLNNEKELTAKKTQASATYTLAN